MGENDFGPAPDSLAKYLDVLTKEKQEQLNAPGKTGWTFKERITVITTVLSVLGVVGSAIAYIQTIREANRLRQSELAQERRTSVATFALDLSDLEKRESAAFAVSTLGAEEALPLLLHHLNLAMSDTVPDPDNSFGELISYRSESFVDALIRSIAAIPNGQGIRELAWLNRTAESPNIKTQSFLIRRLTSPALWAYATAPNLNKTVSLAGVDITDISFSYEESSGADFSSVNLSRIFGCNVKFSRARFQNAEIRDFSVNGAMAIAADFTAANISELKVSSANLRNSTFSNAKLNRSEFKNATMTDVSFEGALLDDVEFNNVDLGGASFSGATFDGVSFDPSYFLEYWRRGARVRGADFSGAQNLSDPDRDYLCRFGATNVPGGCVGIAALSDDEIPSKESFGSSMCF